MRTTGTTQMGLESPVPALEVACPMNAAAEFGIQSEGRLLYALLDAAEESGRLSGTTCDRWHQTRERIRGGTPFETEAAALHGVMTDLAASGAISHTWIEKRWSGISSRLRTVS